MSMNEMVRKALSLGVGVTMTSKERIESFVNDMVKKGELAPGDSKEWIASLVERGEKEKQEWMGLVREQLQKLLHEWNVATREDINRLEQRIAYLEAAGGNQQTQGTEITPQENKTPPAQP